MEYLTSEKDFKYHLKSALTTFASVFLGVLTFLLLPYHGLIRDLRPEDITTAALLAGLSVFFRLAIIAALIALFDLVVVKFGRKKEEPPNS